MKTTKPAISICIPTYEQEGVGASYLAQLLTSIFNQNFDGQIEIVISDNSNNDGISNIVSIFKESAIEAPGLKWEQKYKLIYEKYDQRGISFNTNHTISLATADFIKIMYQDDFFTSPDSLQNFYRALQNDKHWVISDSIYLDDDREFQQRFKAKFNGALVKGINTVGMPSVIAFKKTDISFDSAIKTLLDVDFYLQMGERYGAPAHIEEPLIVQRIHKMSASNNQPNYTQTDLQIIRRKLRNMVNLASDNNYQVPPKLKNYKNLHETPSDINEHFPLLKEIASRCEHVTELGVRHAVSTYAFIEGTPKHLHCYDITASNEVHHAQKHAKQMGVELQYFVKNVLNIQIEETDFLFIDTLHDYEQCKAELKLHGHKARKFIGFHDVTTFGLLNENNTMAEVQGILPAIFEFIEQNPQWHIYKYHQFNNGMLILKKY